MYFISLSVDKYENITYSIKIHNTLNKYKPNTLWWGLKNTFLALIALMRRTKQLYKYSHQNV